jgi:microcystin-dependent protein
MLKLTLTDGTTPLNATQLKISATMTVASLPMTEDIATFTLPAATYTTNGGDGILYFALPDQATVAAALVSKIQAEVPDAYKSMVTKDAVKTALDGATLTYTATVGDDTYTATKTNGYIFAAGTYYAGTLTMAKPAATIVTWDNTNVFTDTNQNKKVDKWSTGPLTFEDVSISFTGSGANSSFTLYGGMGETKLNVFESTGGQYTFTAPSGKQFTKIEITDNNSAVFTAYGDWTKNGNQQAVWSGTPSNTVTLGRGSGYSNSYQFSDLKSIVFTMY